MATDTHAEYLTLAVFPRQQWFGERASVLLLCVYCQSCLLIRSYGTAVFCMLSLIDVDESFNGAAVC